MIFYFQGYLDEILVHDYEFSVLGLECDQSKINAALARRNKQNTQTNVDYADKLKYICTFVSSSNISSEDRDPFAVDEKTSIAINEKTVDVANNEMFIVSRSDEVENTQETSNDTKVKTSQEWNKDLTIIDRNNKHRGFTQETEVPNTEEYTDLNGTNFIQEIPVPNIAECTDLTSILPTEPYCFIGLHTCGDLSVAVIQHFFSLPLARQLIYIPCCYHKLQPVDKILENNEPEFIEEILENDEHELALKILKNCNMESLENREVDPLENPKLGLQKKTLPTTFANFPLSSALTSEYWGRKFLRVPFLRLAAQETAVAWCRYNPGEKGDKVFQLLFRSVLQLYAKAG